MREAQERGNGRGSSSGGPGAATRAPMRSAPGIGLARWLAARRRSELLELSRFWGGKSAGGPHESDEELRAALLAWMSEPARIDERVGQLGRRLGAVVEGLLAAPLYQRSRGELARSPGLEQLSPYELEAAIQALSRRGLVGEGEDRRFESFGQRVLGIPTEVADGLLRKRRERQGGIFGLLTLRGHIDQVYSDPRRAGILSPRRLRELYKMYSQETACTARVERLPDGLRALVQKAILEFGGVLPRAFFERTETGLLHWSPRRWRAILEQSLVGTVQDLDLAPYGIALRDETLTVFNEVALAWLRRVAVPGDPDRPHEELSAGIDLVANISRFLAYLEDHGVRFTLRGEIFKTTEKRILQHLIPEPGRELSREEVLRFIVRFARGLGLVERTGNRTFAVSAAGREWERSPLSSKQRALLDFALAERSPAGESLHQVGMRAVFLRLLKRIEPLVWYDLMYLPFLARNTYLAGLDGERVAEALAERSQQGRFPALEDPQRLAWSLVRWIRERLYLLGLIDLGYDRAGRPVAMRLTKGAARLLGAERARPPSRSHGSLVITPDFEVVLFPSGDDGELIHALDRFCTREKHGSLLHFRLEQEGVVRALRSGLDLADLQGLLETHSRTPVPQNVAFSIRDWALRAGLMRLSSDRLLVCEEPDVLRRLSQDPAVRRYLAGVVDERTVRLRGRVTLRRMQALLRELGYLVELVERAV